MTATDDGGRLATPHGAAGRRDGSPPRAGGDPPRTEARPEKPRTSPPDRSAPSEEEDKRGEQLALASTENETDGRQEDEHARTEAAEPTEATDAKTLVKIESSRRTRCRPSPRGTTPRSRSARARSRTSRSTRRSGSSSSATGRSRASSSTRHGAEVHADVPRRERLQDAASTRARPSASARCST